MARAREAEARGMTPGHVGSCHMRFRAAVFLAAIRLVIDNPWIRVALGYPEKRRQLGRAHMALVAINVALIELTFFSCVCIMT